MPTSKAIYQIPVFDPIPGLFELSVNDKFEPPSYVDEGMEVIAPFIHPEKGPTGLRCKVLVAAGLHARVACEKFDFDKWFPIENLRVEIKPA